MMKCVFLFAPVNSHQLNFSCNCIFFQSGSEKKCWEMRNDSDPVLSGRSEQRSPAVQWHFIMFVFFFLLKSHSFTETIKIRTPKLKSDQSTTYLIIDVFFLLSSFLSSFFILLPSILIFPQFSPPQSLIISSWAWKGDAKSISLLCGSWWEEGWRRGRRRWSRRLVKEEK